MRSPAEAANPVDRSQPSRVGAFLARAPLAWGAGPVDRSQPSRAGAFLARAPLAWGAWLPPLWFWPVAAWEVSQVENPSAAAGAASAACAEHLDTGAMQGLVGSFKSTD